MPFYVVRDRGTGRLLSLLEDRWVKDLREAAVFSQRRTATSSIRVAWRARCVVERIERLPDRIRLARRPRRHSTLPRPVLDLLVAHPSGYDRGAFHGLLCVGHR